MKARRIAALPLALLLALCLAACTGVAKPVPSGESDALDALLSQREQAVLGRDSRAYLATVDPQDKTLLTEERNLIDAAQALSITTYTLEPEAPIRGGEASEALVAQLTCRSTAGGITRTARYPARFVHRGGKLYYAGPDFQTLAEGSVEVDYLGDTGELAQALLTMGGETLAMMRGKLNVAPKGTVRIRLYDDREVFLQSVKLDLPEWVGGWNEYGEAIKTFAGSYGSDQSDYRVMLCHETTHRLVSELSNDNAAYWLQEGLAGFMEEALPAEGSALTAQLPELTPIPLIDLKRIQLEKLQPDDPQVSAYYASAKLYAGFLIAKYGWPDVLGMLKRLAQSELIETSAAEKQLETNTRTSDALAAAFGLDDSGFQKEFTKWRGSKESDD